MTGKTLGCTVSIQARNSANSFDLPENSTTTKKLTKVCSFLTSGKRLENIRNLDSFFFCGRVTDEFSW